MDRTRLRIVSLAALAFLAACEEPRSPELTTVTVTSAADQTALMVGETLQLTAAGTDQDGNPFTGATFTWKSSDAEVAEVDANGLVTATGGGDATITATSGTVSGQIMLTVSGSIHSENITQSQTWRAADGPHLVTRALAVAGSASPVLTIEAGAVVRFASGAGLTFGGVGGAGSLMANGTAAAPITMAADADSPSSGFWEGLWFETNAGPSEIEYVTLSHCGGGNTAFPACILLNGEEIHPLIDHVTVEHSGGHGVVARNGAGFGAGSTTLTVTDATLYPVHIGPNEAGSIPTGGTFTGNAKNAVYLNASLVDETQTWPALGIPYVASVDVIVEGSGGPELTLLPGTEIRLEAGRYFSIGTCGAGGAGTLHAVGTSSAPIVFTANSDSPAAGYWAGLTIECTATATTKLDHAVVEYGGSTSNYAAFTGNVLVEKDLGPIVTNTILRFSKDCGIIRRSPLVTWTTDFTDASLGNTFANNARTQCGP